MIQENSKHEEFLPICEDFSFALNHEHEDFFVCAHFFENTNMKILLFLVFTNKNTKIFGFAKQHEHENFFAGRIEKMNIFARQH